MNNFGIHIINEESVICDNKLGHRELYDWQFKAMEYFFKYNQAIFEVATGVGKTFCAISIIKKILTEENLNILIVVPKNVILEDTWYRELQNNEIKIQDIGIFYGDIKEEGKITLTNMQSIELLDLKNYDFVIFDEIHNYGTSRMLEFVNMNFKYKLGLSATLERMDDNHYKIMDAFGYNVFKYSPENAMDDRILNSFNFINIGIEMDEDSMDKYNTLTEEINFLMQVGGGFKNIMAYSKPQIRKSFLSKLTQRKKLMNNYYKKINIVKKICEEHINNKIIIFNEYNQTTTNLYWNLLDIGLSPLVIHSNIKKEKREQNLIDFKNDKSNVLLTSKVLDEGYNLPKLDVAIINAGNSTNKQTIQRMGRVLRKKDEKSFLYQIYCVGTVEEKYANRRAKLFKKLSEHFEEKTYR